MKIVYVTGEPVLREGTAPEPQPGAGEVTVRVCAAGVTVTELQWYPSRYTKAGKPRARTIPGHEFSGTIAAVGEGVEGFHSGDAVFGMNDWFRDGAMADFCVTEPSYIAPKPNSLSHVEAATVPIGALTAWQGLFDRAKLQPGERVLVHGGTGSVGSFAVQLARWKGARVAATASARNTALAQQLGAEQVMDYHKASLDQAGEFDVVFDTAGNDTLDRSWKVLKPGGRIVTVAGTSADSTEPRVKDAFFIVEPSSKQLSEVSALLETGAIRTLVDAVFPLDQAPDVYSERVVRRRQGKLVISVANC
jgi:NADPH:quinone reductase-like Zn-dependent oxidoreductase